MERIKAHPQVIQVPRQADSFKAGIEGPLGDGFIGYGIQDVIRNGFSLGQINDLYVAAIHGVTKEKNLKGWGFSIFVYAALGQVDVTERFNIDTYVFHTFHLV